MYKMNIKHILDIIGTTAPYTLFIISLLLLRNLKYYLFFYIFGFIINNILNIILKILIKEPRPNNDKIFFELMISNGKRIGYDKYGMPSGHAQNCLFSLAYIILTLNQPMVGLFYIIITSISLIQRYEYKNHTIVQLIIGSIIGILFAYFVYFISTKYIIGKINNKKDDGFFK